MAVQTTGTGKKSKLAFQTIEFRKTVRPASSKALRPPKRRPQAGKDL